MMNRNQKIALGCGGGGCLGLILLVILCVVLVVTGVVPAPGLYNPNSNSNYNSNRNSNYNSNPNSNSNTNTSSSSTMSEDAKHRLYQAAGASKDTELIHRVLKKIGLGDGTGADHQVEFVNAHKEWAKTNRRFILSVLTPEKARAYVEEHIDD